MYSKDAEYWRRPSIDTGIIAFWGPYLKAAGKLRRISRKITLYAAGGKILIIP
jgi:hypothetical protein